MSKVKLKFFIEILPFNEEIACQKMEYAIVPKGKRPEDYLWDSVNLDNQLSKEVFKNTQIKLINVDNLKSASGGWADNIGSLEKQKANTEVMLLKKNRKSITDSNGFTKEMYLPNGAYDAWIKRTDSQWEKAILINGKTGITVSQESKGLLIFNYQIKQYYRYQIVDHRGVAMSDIPFETFTFDSNGGKKKISVVGLDNKKINTKSDLKGFTPPLYSPKGEIIFVEFKFLNKSEFPKKNEIKNYATRSPVNYVSVRLKAIAALTEEDKKTTVLMQGTGKPPVILNMLKEEMIILSKDDYEEFEKESAILDKIFSNSHEAKEKLAKAIKSGQKSNIEEAEKKIEEAQKKIEEELNKNFKKMTDLTEVMTFEVRKKNNPNGNNQEFDFRRRYIRTDRYLQLEQRKKNKQQLKFKALGKTLKEWSELRRTQGNGQVGRTIRDEQWSKVKDEFKNVGKEIELLKWEKNGVWDFPGIGGAFVEQIKLTDNLTVDTQSQWFRCVGGAGASSSVSWKPLKGEVAANLKFSLQGKVILFEGKKKISYTCPSEEGFMLSIYGYDIGAIRAIMAAELFGFAGAKAAADLGVTVSYSKEGRQQLNANGQRNRNPSLANNNAEGRPRFVPMDRDEKIIDGSGASSQGNVEVFAGVEGGLTLGGDFQWLSPDAGDFSTLAKLSASIAGTAGAGGAANFYVYFYNGQFRIKAKAALCVGIGAKGMLDFTVAADKILEFASWVYYCLLRAQFKVLRYIAPDAFEVLKNAVVLALGNDSAVVGTLKDTQKEIVDFNKRMDKAEASNAMALKIKRKSEWLRKGPPDSKGMLLYEMTRHGTETHVADFGLTYHLPNHKEAVISIFETVTTIGEWNNILQRISIKGEKSNTSILTIENSIKEFLRSGFWAKSTDTILDSVEPIYNKSKDVITGVFGNSEKSNTQVKPIELNLETKYVEKFNSLKSKLLKEYPLHTAVVLNDTPEFDLLCAEINQNPKIVNNDVLFASLEYKFEPIIIDSSEADEFILAMNQNENDRSNIA